MPDWELVKLKHMYFWLDNYTPGIFIYNDREMLNVSAYLSEAQYYHIIGIMASYIKEAIEDIQEAAE